MEFYINGIIWCILVLKHYKDVIDILLIFTC